MVQLEQSLHSEAAVWGIDRCVTEMGGAAQWVADNSRNLLKNEVT